MEEIIMKNLPTKLTFQLEDVYSDSYTVYEELSDTIADYITEKTGYLVNSADIDIRVFVDHIDYDEE